MHDKTIDAAHVQAFFDGLAEGWDSHCHHDKERVARILDCADIAPGDVVLDIGCGTGVLIPAYLERGASRIVGVDLAPRMIACAQGKFPGGGIEFIAGDAEKIALPACDKAVVYSAFPHFAHPGQLAANIARSLVPSGRLTIAHSERREAIDARHGGGAAHVSFGLMPAGELARILRPFYHVDIVVDDDVYVVSGVRREGF